MKTLQEKLQEKLQEIKDQVAFENDWIDWVCFKADCDITDIEIITDIVTKRFAIEVAKEALNNADEATKDTLQEFGLRREGKLSKCLSESILSETNMPKL